MVVVEVVVVVVPERPQDAPIRKNQNAEAAGAAEPADAAGDASAGEEL